MRLIAARIGPRTALRGSAALVAAGRVTWGLVGVASALLGIALIGGCTGELPTRDGGTVKPSAITTDTPSTETTSSGLTVGTTEGPYYVTGTRELPDGNVNYTGLPGETVRVRGFVYDGSTGTTPLPGARIEIWQADSEGSYHPNANGDASEYSASELVLRGHVIADENGGYEFTTIYPGEYTGRTRHIHVRASADSFGAVATQLIVPALEGDSLTPETDQIARSLPEANDLVFEDVDGVRTARFDFRLGRD